MEIELPTLYNYVKVSSVGDVTLFYNFLLYFNNKNDPKIEPIR